MPFYQTLAVLALAASTVSPALSAPVQYGLPLSLNRGPGLPDLLNLSREIRGQSLSRREPVSRGLPFLKPLNIKGALSLFGGASSKAGSKAGSGVYKTSKPAADAAESGGSAATSAAAKSGSAATKESTGELPSTPATTSESLTTGKPPGAPSTASKDDSVIHAYDGAEWHGPTWKKRAFHDDHGLPGNLFGKPCLNLFFQAALLMVSSLPLAFKARSVSSRNNLNR